MTLYEITATRVSDDSEVAARITAKNEDEAKKAFRESNKADGNGQCRVTEIEIVSENVPASKAQERKTLEAIKQMVDDLGENSYLATAFDGCFEIAESNIDNDFGESMKQRAEIAEEKVRESEAERQELTRRLEAERRENEIKAKLIVQYEARKMPEYLKDFLEQFLHVALGNTREAIIECAQEITRWTAGTEAYHNAYARFQNAIEKKAELEKAIEQFEACK